MAIEIRLEKSGNTPWGFRLTGGVEFEEPLTVVKVEEGSIAHQSGLKVGDLVVRLNDVATSGLTHTEAHDVILNSGYDLTIGVRREDFVSPSLESSHKEEDLNLTDEEIASIISGKEEVINHIESTSVATVIEQEETQVNLEEKQSEIEVQERKWSTFLQKPKNPKPKPKKKEPEKPQAPPYRVIIKKQKKKNQEEMQQEEINTVQAMLQSIESQMATNHSVEVNESHYEESSSNHLEIESSHQEYSSHYEQVEATQHVEVEASQHVEIECSQREEMVVEEANQIVEQILEQAESQNQSLDLSRQISLTAKALEEQLAKLQARQSSLRSSQSLEEQLAQVQDQLLALAQLPSAITQTLTAVTQQLEKIVTVQAEEHEENEITYEENTTTEDDITEREVTTEETQAMLTTHYEESEKETFEEVCQRIEMHSEGQIQEVSQEIKDLIVEHDSDEGLTEDEREEKRIRKEKEAKQQKESEQLRESHQRRLEQRPTNPLTPLERPIILPGGRKWSQPDDACPKIKNPKMTDEKIASTIETFSEVIVGRTKGINFLKYQPPPKKLDHLQRSEVYRMIHDMEPPARGIVARASLIVAEQDYYQATN